MKTAVSFCVCLVLVMMASMVNAGQDEGWPRTRTQDGNVLTAYQPQIDSWKDFRELDWRMAFSLSPRGGKPVVGVAEMHGQTIVDNEAKTVFIANMKVKKTYLPSLDVAAAAQMEQLFRSFLPPAFTIGLQQFVAGVPKPDSRPPSVQLRNDPPTIFVSYKPAILLDMDGQPVTASIKNTRLQFVVNTRWPLFFDQQVSMYYLLVGDQWLKADALQGPWSSAKTLPQDMNIVSDQPEWPSLKKVVPPPKSSTPVPAVFYSTSPAEVILFNGKPAYAQIPGTRLKYATNTMSYVFLYTPTNHYYYLTAGRWFSAPSLSGPWTFATPNLPVDFAHIPSSSPAGQVRASVPGTEEAKDAVLLAQVPTTVIVNPVEAAKTVKVVYAGDPQLVAIEGTTLYYIKNTQQTVIKAGDLYYLCFQGIWFASTSPVGPWKTASSVPQVIYTIPPSSPVYNVTYVTQVTTADGSVQASYTAGYTGAYIMGVATGVILTCGTGYYYPPYVAIYPGWAYPVYYPPPYTYGPWTHYQSPTGAYGVSQTVYGPYGSATRTASYNPYTGTYARTASATTPYGSAFAGQAYNPYTGTAGATRQGSNAYASWGSSVVTKGGEAAYTHHYSTDKGTVASGRTTAGGRSVAVSSDRGTTTATKTGSGDMYASHDGNVYKNTGSGWQKYDNGNWVPVDKPPKQSSQSASQQGATGRQTSSYKQGQTSSQGRQYPGQGTIPQGQTYQQQGQQRTSGGEQMEGLQTEAQNRQRGEQWSQRSQQYERSGGSENFGGLGGSSRTSGGGLSRGGGSGGRRRR